MAKKPGSKGAAVAAKAKAGKKQQKETSQGSKTGSSSSKTGSSSSKASGLRDPLDRELALLGLRVKSITADGNCFFRALSDQLQGDEALHSDLRCRVVALMSERADDFAPFVEDDQSLDAYLARMKREGVWAGHMELQAASLLLQANIAVYQAGQPRWCITNHPPGSRMLHVSYHDGEHYNSVRRWDDYSRGSPADIPDSLAPIADTAQVQQCWSAVDEKRVAEGTGCDNPLLVQQQLQACGGDVEAAIEAVIEIMAGEGDVEPGEQETAAAAAAGAEEGHAAAAAAVGEGVGVAVSQPSGAAGGQGQQGEGESGVSGAAAAAGSGELPGSPTSAPDDSSSSEQQGGLTAATAAGNGDGEVGQTQASSTKTAGGSDGVADSSSKGSSSSSKAQGVRLKGGSSSSSKGVSGGARRGGDKAEKAPSRNKACPCGSGRKHKVCCGAPGAAQKGGKAAAVAANAGAAEGLPAALATLHI